MGVTVFDLFNEVLSQTDLESFLHSHGINYGDYRGHGLILRSFLLLVDLCKNISSKAGFGETTSVILR